MCHIEFPHAGAHVDILVAPVALLAYRGVGESLLGELSQGLPGQDVSRAPSKVATPVFEMMSEVDGFVGIERFKKSLRFSITMNVSSSALRNQSNSFL